MAKDEKDQGWRSPARVLLVVALLCFIVCAVAAGARLRQRGVGLVLEADPKAEVVHVAAVHGPAAAAGIPTGARLVSVAAGDRTVDVRPSDLIDEPDFFDTYPEMADFFQRQTELAAILAADEVVVTVTEGEGPPTPYRTSPAPAPPTSLPGIFWFQVLAGATAFLLSMWVLVLRPGSTAVRIFAIFGATIPLFTLPAAVYSTRELAVDGTVFRALSSLNHFGANLFGCALIAFFCVYPVQLLRTRWLWGISAFFMGWWVLDAARIAPDQNFGARLPILLEMVGGLVLGIVQWRRTKSDPRGRAGLRWLGVSVLVGAGLFVFSVVGATVLGLFPPLAQGYSFGFFLLMHVGFALGLRRHRLFDLEEWAYSLLLWMVAGFAVVGLDVVLVAFLNADRGLSAGLAILVCGFVYLPIRNWLWSKTVARRMPTEHELFDAVLGVTFASSTEERGRLWKSLLAKLFDPVELTSLEEPVTEVAVLDDGLRLEVPGAAGIPSQRLTYPWRGRGLFGKRHQALAEDVVTLLRHAESRREAFESGVREERARVARDMHDDVGSSLMSSLYREDLTSTRDAVRQALGDVRSIVHELTGRGLTLLEVIVEMRREGIQRLEAASITCDWPVFEGDLGAPREHRVYRHLTSMMRELTSNAIRHSGAKKVTVRVESDAERIVITFADDGRGFDPTSERTGSGLGNLERRAKMIGGTIVYTREDGLTRARIELPISASPAETTSPPSA